MARKSDPGGASSTFDSELGKSVVLDEKPVTVVGVLPPSFDFASVFAPGTNVDMFVPLISISIL